MFRRSAMTFLIASSLVLMGSQAMADNEASGRIYSNMSSNNFSCSGAANTTPAMAAGSFSASTAKNGAYKVGITLRHLIPNATYDLTFVCRVYIGQQIHTDAAGNGKVSFLYTPITGDNYLLFDGYVTGQGYPNVTGPGYFESTLITLPLAIPGGEHSDKDSKSTEKDN
jgi:hypothetical protein